MLIKQIYFDEFTKGRCFQSPFVDLVYNEKCTPFFENDIIVNQTPESDYFGVLSWQFIDKVRPLPNRSLITPEYIAERLDVDMVSFFSKNKNKNVFSLCDRYHPGSITVFKEICHAVGYVPELIDEDTRITIYQNAFIAKTEIYKQYIDELLKPAMQLMTDNEFVKSIIWKDSGYYKKQWMTAKLKRELGVDYYPYHTFICERLISLFLQKHKSITVKHLL